MELIINFKVYQRCSKTMTLLKRYKAAYLRTLIRALRTFLRRWRLRKIVSKTVFGVNLRFSNLFHTLSITDRDLNSSFSAGNFPYKLRTSKVFKQMSVFIGTRSSVQCRSQNQRLFRKYKNIRNIVNSFKE